MIRFRDWKLTGSIDACQADHKTIVFTVTGLPKEYFKWELIWVFGSYVDILPLTLNAEGDIASRVFERENLPFAGFYTAQLRGHNRAGGTRHTDEIVVKVGGTYSEDVKFPTLPNSFAAYMDALIRHEGNIENPHKTTAAQVGARPDTWTPSTSDVGAAPAGYGLGEMNGAWIESEEDLNNLTAGGWYHLFILNYKIANVGFNHAGVLVKPIESGACVQEICPLNTNYSIRRYLYNGTWSEPEVDNPPMNVGVEYRTTERWGGKAVYKKAINLGGLPNGESSIAHNITLQTALSVALTDGGSAINQYRYIDKVWFDRGNVNIITTNDLLANASIIATLAYIKN